MQIGDSKEVAFGAKLRDGDLNVSLLRGDFPTIREGGVYLDSVASSLTPLSVVEAMNDYYLKYRANVHRGSYDLSLQASERFEAALANIASFIGAGAHEVVITSNATHALNLVALSLDFEPGDEVVLSSLEHTSNMVPWVRLAKKEGIKLRWYNPGKDGVFNLEAFEKLLTAKTRLVTLSQVSNVLGSVVPVEEVSRLCKERGVLFLIDACQAAPHIKLDVSRVECDFMAFSGHKMLGPTGVGVLYMKQEHAEALMPGILGGGTINTAECHCESLETCNIDACTYSDLPFKWQAGTPPIAETLGLSAAIDYLNSVGIENVDRHGKLLMREALDGLQSIPGVEIFGPRDAEQRTGIVSFNVGDLQPPEVGQILNDNFNIAVRSGHHCAINYFREVQDPDAAYGNVRASFYLYNTEEEVQHFLSAVEDIAATCL